MAGYIVNQDIFDAIHRRHWLQFRIGQFIHVVEPHCYYVENGKQLLQAWHLLTAGSDPNVPVGWVHYQTDEMRDVRMLAETFEGMRPDYRRANTENREIHCQL
jgi:hypothetical protein